MLLTQAALGFFLLCPLVPPAQQSAALDDPYPASTALEQGVSPKALSDLDELVQSLVSDEEVLGAELLVIKNGHSILHGAYGWADRESQRPMEVGSVFCVRSMTKPVVGTAILMLIGDDKLELDDKLAKFLPSFDAESTRDITVEQLLQHTSGLPMSLLFGKDLKQLHAQGGIRAVADLGGGHELGFAPGSAFNYSDQGADTLTALIEVVSGMPAADFVRQRVLDPLGMSSSTCVMSQDHPLRARALSSYAGSKGSWTRFWSPADAPLFPFFLGSQGLYASLEDYARFMQLWLDKGRVGRERLVASRHVRKALTPGPYPLPSSTGFRDLEVDYGYLMELWTKQAEDGDKQVVAFGHNGSDGTHAWVFPQQKAIVLYFTQSRMTPTGSRVEEALARLFLGAKFDPNEAAPPLEQYLGYYWEGENDLYRAIVRDGDDLALEILGRAVVPLTYIGQDRWKLRPQPATVIEFQRSESGEVSGYKIGDHEEFRFEPSDALPSADEVAERVAQTHRIDLLETLGPVRTTGELNIEKMGMTGQVSATMAWPDRFRVDTQMGENSEHVVIDGATVRISSSQLPAKTLAGERADEVRLDTNLVRLGDWHRWFPKLRVIQRLEQASPDSDEPDVMMLVRAGDLSAPARTFYVHWGTGRLFREENVVHIEGVGRIGQKLTFGDYRDVSGMLLPHRIQVELANPLIGSIVSTVTKVELGVELPEDAFELHE